MKQRLLIISLLIVSSIPFNEASDLFKITEDAISVGREIMKEVEQTFPKNTTITDVYSKLFKSLWKFHGIHNVPIQWVPVNTLMYTELKSSFTLQQYFTKFSYQYELSLLPTNLKESFDYEKESNSYIEYKFQLLKYYLEENVFDLQLFKSMMKNMNNLNELLFKMDPDTGDTIMNILTNKTSEWECWSSSRQQLLYGLLYYIIHGNAFVYIFMQNQLAFFKVNADVPDIRPRYHSLAFFIIRASWTEKDVIKKMKKFEQHFIEQNTKLLDQFFKAMTGQPRETTYCIGKQEPDFYPVEKDYTKLNAVFQNYIVNEVDLNEDGTCKKQCDYYKETKQYGCYDDVRICKRQRICNGIIRDCKTQINSPMKVCISDEGEESRYKFILTKAKTYGKKNSCDKIVQAKNWPRGFFICEYCTCTCENIDKSIDRYFSVRPVLSDMDSNYVITNARFVKENNVVHIQIEEGKLIGNALIHHGTLRWKKLDNFTISDDNIKEGIDYHTISWHKRKVYLEKFDSASNHVLTGLRLYSTRDGIKLNVFFKPFDFKTGKLLDGGEWMMNTDFNSDVRTELKLENKDDINRSYSSQYIEFTTSNMNDDVGQSTVPYLSTRSVLHDETFKMPFSGAGIIVKSEKDIGSLLALKFLTYNIMENVQ